MNNQLKHDYDTVFDFVLSKTHIKQSTEQVNLANLSGRVLAETLYSPINLPNLAISAMDGYGFSTKSKQDLLPVVETICAGRVDLSQGISSRKAVKIMTGAVIPEGVDCVIPQEQALLQQGDTQPLLIKPQKAIRGQHIKAVGSDVKKGACLFKQGHLMRAQDIALLASVGIAQVAVFEKVKVVVLVSGDELVEPGQTLSSGQIYDANSSLIGELVKQLPAELLACEMLPDDAATIESRLFEWSKKADILITIGGASVGQKDHVKTVLNSLKKHWSWTLNMKPAKPFSMALLNDGILVALPGNPLAAFMSFQLFVKAVIQKSAGLVKWQPKSQRLPLIESSLKLADKVQWLQVKRTEKGLKPLLNGSSSQLTQLVNASGFIRVNPQQACSKGDLVLFWPY
ncbi:MAG: molybdopterin molybdotransferase MoeA [Thiotrichales bacterium]|nr:molybdopterin molybdotransferase MoeA [Thiotrichales bacterium]